MDKVKISQITTKGFENISLGSELKSIDRDIESLKKKRAELEKSISSKLEKLFENNENEYRIRK